MPITKTDKIWHNGKFINWDDATLHVLSHVVSYASAVFEGIRCYETKQGPAIFRLREHMQRLINSAKIYRMELPYTVDDFCNTATELVRLTANYMNSQLIRMEASFNGYTEGIALDTEGHVSEGSGMNVFLVHDGTLYTPPLATSILPGITRDTVVKIAEDLKIPVKERVIPREMLYIVDEVFFAGTAVEITPIRSVDHIQVGKGVAGPITRKLQEEFFALTSGNKPDRHNWLTPITAPVTAATP